MGSIFGFVLIGGAELALRQAERVRDDRVRQALSGAGIASLYASVLVASNLYHLISPLAAMLGMAAVTALAMGLSLRFGAPSALLGLAGGLAAPALIGSEEPNIALLSLYLALAVGGLCTLSRGQRWAWLGISALVGGFGWGLLLMLGGALSVPETISVGLYLMLLGVALPMLGFAGNWQARLRLITAIAAAAQMAALVAMGGFAMDVNLDQRACRHFLEHQLIGIEQEMMLRPRDTRRQMGEDQIVPAIICDQPVRSGKVDADRPFV